MRSKLERKMEMGRKGQYGRKELIYMDCVQVFTWAVSSMVDYGLVSMESGVQCR